MGLGHEVQECDLTSFQTLYYETKTRSDLVLAQEEFYQKVTMQLRKAVSGFKPHLVFALALAPLRVDLLAGWRKSGILTAAWFVENFSRFPVWRNQARHYDHYFVIQKGKFVDLLGEVGANEVHYLPNACPDMALSYGDGLGERPSIASLAFMGSPFPERVKLFEKLSDLPLSLWGRGWRGCSVALEPLVQIGDRLVTPDEEIEIYSRSEIVLNPHTALGSKGGEEWDFINPRTFVAAGCGAFQLVDKRSLLEQHFKIGHEIVVYENCHELREKIAYYLEHAEERKLIGSRAQERVKKDHSYRRRMEEMLQCVFR